jgi:hypothetical protein
MGRSRETTNYFNIGRFDMARLDSTFSPAAFRIRNLISQKRRGEVVTKAADYLRAGFKDEKFLSLVADLLDPKTAPHLYPKKKEHDWYGIGRRFEELHEPPFDSDYDNRKKKIGVLTEEYKCESRTIESALAIYKKACSDYDAANRGEL